MRQDCYFNETRYRSHIVSETINTVTGKESLLICTREPKWIPGEGVITSPCGYYKKFRVGEDSMHMSKRTVLMWIIEGYLENKYRAVYTDQFDI